MWRARSSAGSEISVGICAPLEAVLLHGDSNALPGTLPPSSAAAQSWGGSTRASTPSREEDETHIHEVLVCSSPGADSVDFSRYLLIYPHCRLAARLQARFRSGFACIGHALQHDNTCCDFGSNFLARADAFRSSASQRELMYRAATTTQRLVMAGRDAHRAFCVFQDREWSEQPDTLLSGLEIDSRGTCGELRGTDFSTGASSRQFSAHSLVRSTGNPSP